jgi:UDP-N-acetylmuramyl tripeptide synthase
VINKLLIAIGKAVSTLSLTLNLGSGSTWPGHFALKANKHFIKDLLKNSHTKVVLIAGTNGKTTTSTLITHILEKNNKKVIQNTSGANLLNGIASTLLLQTDHFGNVDADYAIFEVDENALPKLLKEITPDTLILLNLFRDQLDRYGEVNSIVSHWEKAFNNLPATTTLILNADDPEISYLGHSTKAKVLYFGLDDTKLALTSFQHASDSLYCPKCREKLTYTTRYFSHLGDWACSKCGLKRPILTVTKFSLYPLSGIYNMYNTHAAVLFVKEQGFSQKQIEQGLKDFTAAFGRQEVVTYYGKNIQLFLSKNPTSFNQSIRTIKELGAKYLLLVLNDQTPDGKDVSWIWDADMEDYTASLEKLYVSGDRVYDMALRLKYAAVSKNNMTTYEKLDEAIHDAVMQMPKTETLFILPTYSAMLETRKIITGKKIL